MNRDRDRHLSEGELEFFLPGHPPEAGAEPAPADRDHLDGCPRCRRELAELESLHTALRALPELSPSPGFTVGVMERVRLPVPWYVRAWSLLREHWVVAALALAGVIVAVSGTSAWLASQPALTVGGMMDFVLTRITTAFWAGVLGLGRLVYASGLPELIETVRSQIGLAEAAGALASLSLASIAAAAGMAKLLTPPPMAMGAGRS